MFLKKFPAEMILTFDEVVFKHFAKHFLNFEERETFDKVVKVRLVDLREKN